MTHVTTSRRRTARVCPQIPAESPAAVTLSAAKGLAVGRTDVCRHSEMLRCAQHDNRTRACRKGKVCSAAAFSLAELVLVVAIIAIISAIAVPRYASALVRYRADAAARRVVADLSLARHLARQTGQSRTVTFNTVTGRVRIIGQSGMDAPASNYETNLAAAPYQAAITAADFGGDATIIFNGYGVPDSGGAATVAAGDATKTIAVDAVTGQASIQ